MIGEIYVDENDEEEGIRNAELAAAAPELAKCLRELADFSVDDSHYQHAEQAAAARKAAYELLKRLNA